MTIYYSLLNRFVLHTSVIDLIFLSTLKQWGPEYKDFYVFSFPTGRLNVNKKDALHTPQKKSSLIFRHRTRKKRKACHPIFLEEARSFLPGISNNGCRILLRYAFPSPLKRIGFCFLKKRVNTPHKPKEFCFKRKKRGKFNYHQRLLSRDSTE